MLALPILGLLLLQAAAPAPVPAAAPQQFVPPKFVVPNYSELKLKIRETRGLQMPSTSVWYFKGARQRIEHGFFGAHGLLPTRDLQPAMPVPWGMEGPVSVQIFQCDQNTAYHLVNMAKAYRTFPIRIPEQPPREHPQLERVVPPSGPDVNITIDSQDTGERRQIAGYEARRIKTTITVEPSKGAKTKPSKVDIDAWYLDLPAIECREIPTTEDFLPGMAPFILPGPGVYDHKIYKRIGIAPHGFVIERTTTRRMAGNIETDKTELLEVSGKPLADSLFEPPADFRAMEPGQPMVVDRIRK
jgi:hypothetical protein